VFIFLNSINRLIFVLEKVCVMYEVGTKFLATRTSSECSTKRSLLCILWKC